MLLSHEVYKRIKSLDINPVLRVIDRLKFIDSNGKCAWVTAPDSQAPSELLDLVRSAKLGGVYKRMFCRKLMPRQGILPHIDDWIPQEEKWRRFHIPLISDPSIKMRWPDDKVELYLEPGYLYEVRVDRVHEVVNECDTIERIHIQLDMENATIL